MSDRELDDALLGQSMRAKELTERASRASESIDGLESRVRALLEERGLDPDEALAGVHAEETINAKQTIGTWDDLVAFNRSWLSGAGLEDAELDDLFTPEELDQFESFSRLGREKWAVSDFVTVGGCAVIGTLATVFDDQIDAAAKMGLGGLKNTALVKGWEKAGKDLPIDYTGPKFGGPGHRVRSGGHDLGRPWEALDQIRKGEFRGVYWDNGQLVDFASRVTPSGTPYAPHGLGESLLLWLQHLGADLVTETSLPLPWWSKLYELPQRDMRKLAHELYNPTDTTGLNVRSAFISKTLPVITTELVIGVKVHLDAWSLDRRLRSLTADEKLRRNEMLLAGHAATGLSAIGKVAVLAPAENLVALRHLNLPALARIGFLSFQVGGTYVERHRQRSVPSWDELLEAAPLPWELDEIAAMASRQA